MYRILIVDDEHLIRESIQKKVEKSPIPFSEILQAETQEQALSLVLEKPFNLIVCDIRLGKDNGLNFLEIVRSHCKETAFIVLSGYSEFSYARAAISLRVVDYLLKPINTADFYSALERGIEQNQKFKNSTQSTTKEKKQSLERQLQAEFEENIATNRFTVQNHISEYQLGKNQFLSASIYIPKAVVIEFDLLNEVLEKNTFWAWGKNYIAFLRDEKTMQFFFCMPLSAQTVEMQQIELLLHEIETLFFQNHLFRFTIGISEPQENLRNAYEQSFICLEHRILQEENNVIPYNKIFENSQSYLLTSEKRSYYRMLLKGLNYKAMQAFYADLELDLRGVPRIGYFYIQTLYNILKDEMISLYPALFQGRTIIMVAYYFDSVPAMMDYLKKLFMYIIEKESDGQEKNWLLITLNAIKQSVEQHFAENLSLEDFAKQNHISASFLSGQFSQQFGISYQDYLSQVRIQHAQKLLKESKYSIYEISYLCGFSNQHYFSKVFKKKTGQTPSDYRHTRP